MFQVETSFFFLIIVLILSTYDSTKLSADEFNITLIETYTMKYIPSYVSIVSCFKAYGNYLLSKKISEQFKYLEIFSMMDPNIVFRIRNKSFNFHEGIIFFSYCDGYEEFLVKSGEMELFDSTHHWLIISNSLDVLYLLNRTKLNIECNINILIPIENSRNNFDIVDVYNPASQHGGILNYRTIGKYSNKEGYKIQNQEMKYASRRNMTGVDFKAAVVLPVDIEYPIVEYLKYDGQREVNTFNRFNAKLLFFCKEYFNFSISKISVLKSWGYLLENNSFDGMVGALERHEIDFGLSPLFVRPERLSHIDYGIGTWIFRGAFLFRKPKLSTNFSALLKPLSFFIWISTLGFFILSICLYKLISFVLKSNNDSFKEKISWTDLVLFSCGTIGQQGTVIYTNFICGRIVLLSVIILSYLIYQFYSASIVSYLVMKPSSLIKTPEDLLASKMECRVENTLFMMDYFIRAKDGVTSALYRKNRMESSNKSYFIPVDAGLRQVKKGGFAFHAELATAYPILTKTFPEQIICELQEIEIIRTQQAHCVFRRKSPFKEMFNVEIQRFAEVGILRRELNHWHPKKPECLNLSNTMKYTVGLEDLYPAFMLLISGVIISIVISFIEAYIFSSSTEKKFNARKLFLI